MFEVNTSLTWGVYCMKETSMQQFNFIFNYRLNNIFKPLQVGRKCKLYAVVRWVALLFYIWGMVGSNLKTETGCLLCSSLCLKLRLHCFITYPFQFCIYKSCYWPLYNLKFVKTNQERINDKKKIKRILDPLWSWKLGSKQQREIQNVKCIGEFMRQTTK